MTSDTFETRLAWLAGIIDGEGGIYIAVYRATKRPNGPRVNRFLARVGIYNTNATLIQCAKTVGTEIGVKSTLYLRPALRATHKPCYALQFVGTNAKRLIEAVSPYLVAKQAQAILMLEFFAWRSRYQHRGRWDKALVVQAEQIVRQYGHRLKAMR